MPALRIKKTGQINDNLFLREDAANLAAFLYRMREEHPKHYERIVRTIQLVVPMFRDFLLRPDPFNPETIRLEWQDRDSDYIFGASELSDGSCDLCVLRPMFAAAQPALVGFVDGARTGPSPCRYSDTRRLVKKHARTCPINRFHAIRGAGFGL